LCQETDAAQAALPVWRCQQHGIRVGEEVNMARKGMLGSRCAACDVDAFCGCRSWERCDRHMQCFCTVGPMSRNTSCLPKCEGCKTLVTRWLNRNVELQAGLIEDHDEFCEWLDSIIKGPGPLSSSAPVLLESTLVEGITECEQEKRLLCSLMENSCRDQLAMEELVSRPSEIEKRRERVERCVIATFFLALAYTLWQMCSSLSPFGRADTIIDDDMEGPAIRLAKFIWRCCWSVCRGMTYTIMPLASIRGFGATYCAYTGTCSTLCPTSFWWWLLTWLLSGCSEAAVTWYETAALNTTNHSTPVVFPNTTFYFPKNTTFYFPDPTKTTSVLPDNLTKPALGLVIEPPNVTAQSNVAFPGAGWKMYETVFDNYTVPSNVTGKAVLFVADSLVNMSSYLQEYCVQPFVDVGRNVFECVGSDCTTHVFDYAGDTTKSRWATAKKSFTIMWYVLYALATDILYLATFGCLLTFVSGACWLKRRWTRKRLDDSNFQLRLMELCEQFKPQGMLTEKQRVSVSCKQCIRRLRSLAESKSCVYDAGIGPSVCFCKLQFVDSQENKDRFLMCAKSTIFDANAYDYPDETLDVSLEMPVWMPNKRSGKVRNQAAYYSQKNVVHGKEKHAQDLRRGNRLKRLEEGDYERICDIREELDEQQVSNSVRAATLGCVIATAVENSDYKQAAARAEQVNYEQNSMGLHEDERGRVSVNAGDFLHTPEERKEKVKSVLKGLANTYLHKGRFKAAQALIDETYFIDHPSERPELFRHDRDEAYKIIASFDKAVEQLQEKPQSLADVAKHDALHYDLEQQQIALKKALKNAEDKVKTFEVTSSATMNARDYNEQVKPHRQEVTNLKKELDRVSKLLKEARAETNAVRAILVHNPSAFAKPQNNEVSWADMMDEEDRLESGTRFGEFSGVKAYLRMQVCRILASSPGIRLEGADIKNKIIANEGLAFGSTEHPDARETREIHELISKRFVDGAQLENTVGSNVDTAKQDKCCCGHIAAKCGKCRNCCSGCERHKMKETKSELESSVKQHDTDVAVEDLVSGFVLFNESGKPFIKCIAAHVELSGEGDMVYAALPRHMTGIGGQIGDLHNILKGRTLLRIPFNRMSAEPFEFSDAVLSNVRFDTSGAQGSADILYVPIGFKRAGLAAAKIGKPVVGEPVQYFRWGTDEKKDFVCKPTVVAQVIGDTVFIEGNTYAGDCRTPYFNSRGEIIGLHRYSARIVNSKKLNSGDRMWNPTPSRKGVVVGFDLKEMRRGMDDVTPLQGFVKSVRHCIKREQPTKVWRLRKGTEKLPVAHVVLKPGTDLVREEIMKFSKQVDMEIPKHCLERAMMHVVSSDMKRSASNYKSPADMTVDEVAELLRPMDLSSSAGLSIGEGGGVGSNGDQRSFIIKNYPAVDFDASYKLFCEDVRQLGLRLVNGVEDVRLGKIPWKVFGKEDKYKFKKLDKSIPDVRSIQSPSIWFKALHLLFFGKNDKYWTALCDEYAVGDDLDQPLTIDVVMRLKETVVADGTDATGWDRYVPRPLMEWYFDGYLRKMVRGIPTPVIDFFRHNTIDSHLFVEDGTSWLKDHGNPSGYPNTLRLNCVVNKLVTYACETAYAESCGKDISCETIDAYAVHMFCGDDMARFLCEEIAFLASNDYFQFCSKAFPAWQLKLEGMSKRADYPDGELGTVDYLSAAPPFVSRQLVYMDGMFWRAHGNFIRTTARLMHEEPEEDEALFQAKLLGTNDALMHALVWHDRKWLVSSYLDEYKAIFRPDIIKLEQRYDELYFIGKSMDTLLANMFL
jgi:hypothetical protein